MPRPPHRETTHPGRHRALRSVPVPSPMYPGERVRVRGRLSSGHGRSIDAARARPLTPALSPVYRGEGVMALARDAREKTAGTRHACRPFEPAIPFAICPDRPRLRPADRRVPARGRISPDSPAAQPRAAAANGHPAPGTSGASQPRYPLVNSPSPAVWSHPLTGALVASDERQTTKRQLRRGVGPPVRPGTRRAPRRGSRR